MQKFWFNFSNIIELIGALSINMKINMVCGLTRISAVDSSINLLILPNKLSIKVPIRQ